MIPSNIHVWHTSQAAVHPVFFLPFLLLVLFVLCASSDSKRRENLVTGLDLFDGHLRAVDAHLYLLCW